MAYAFCELDVTRMDAMAPASWAAARLRRTLTAAAAVMTAMIAATMSNSSDGTPLSRPVRIDWWADDITARADSWPRQWPPPRLAPAPTGGPPAPRVRRPRPR